MAKCECGCCEIAKEGSRFIHGHNQRGKVAWNRGKKCPWAKNLSQSFQKGSKPWNTNLNISGMSGKKQSEFCKKRVSEVHLGSKHRQDSKDKMSESRLKGLASGNIKIWNKGLTYDDDNRIVHAERCYLWKGGITPINKALRNRDRKSVV